MSREPLIPALVVVFLFWSGLLTLLFFTTDLSRIEQSAVTTSDLMVSLGERFPPLQPHLSLPSESLFHPLDSHGRTIDDIDQRLQDLYDLGRSWSLPFLLLTLTLMVVTSLTTRLLLLVPPRKSWHRSSPPTVEGIALSRGRIRFPPVLPSIPTRRPHHYALKPRHQQLIDELLAILHARCHNQANGDLEPLRRLEQELQQMVQPPNHDPLLPLLLVLTQVRETLPPDTLTGGQTLLSRLAATTTLQPEERTLLSLACRHLHTPSRCPLPPSKSMRRRLHRLLKVDPLRSPSNEG